MSTLLAVTGGRVLTMADGAAEIPDGTVLVEDGEIVAAGPSADVAVPAAAEVVDARGCAVLPGFVNAHTHVPQILLRGGASSNRNLLDWLLTALRPGLDGYTAADIACAYRLYCVEAFRAGVTTIVSNDHVGPMDYVAAAEPAIEALDTMGMRAVYARMFADRRPEGSLVLVEALRRRRPEVRRVDVERPTADILADLERLIRAFDGRAGGRIRVVPSPCTTNTVSVEALRASRRWADDHTGLWALHLQETPDDRMHADLSSVEYLDAHGLLGPSLLAGHCVHVDTRDIRLLRRHDVAVSTQPVSNGVLGSGVAPVPDLVDHGLRLGMGTDDGNCNDSVNPLADLKTMGVLHRATRRDVGAITARQLLEIATAGGARAIGMGDRIGTLEPGKQADLIVVDLQRPNMVPAHDLAESLVWQTNGTEVRDVLVAGRVVLRDRRAVTLDRDERSLLEEAATRSRRLVERAGLVA